MSCISYTAYDPDTDPGTTGCDGKTTTGSIRTVAVALYKYNASKQLVTVTDPRTNLATSYAYSGTSSSGQPLLTGFTPAGQKAYALVYGSVAAGAGTDAHGLQVVSRANPTSGSSQVARFVYGINPAVLTSGLPDMRNTSDDTVGVSRWGRTTSPPSGSRSSGPTTP
ncbi:hypothetical protein [Luteimicrobium album]|uniref:hypothetical protein n=1 Tax=Luteimicrobium album TaxID=1054550 RepID=UPI0024E18318|nr:hypothetical protein [Luteimicrobium album]